jgi:hypothetical protein
LALEIRMEVHMGEVTSPTPTTKGCDFPSRIALGQNERVLLCLIERLLPDENQTMMLSA